MWFDQLTQRSCGAEKIQNILSGTNDMPIGEETCIQIALEALSQLRSNQCLAAEWQTMDPSSAQDTYINGGAAMILMGSWMTAELVSIGTPEYQYAVIPFPSMEEGEGNQNAIFGRALVWNIPAESDNPELAIEFLKRLTNTTTAARAVDQMSIISALNKAPVPEVPAGMGAIIESTTQSGAELLPIHFGLHLNEQLAHAWYQPAIQVLAGQITPIKALNLLEQGLSQYHNGE